MSEKITFKLDGQDVTAEKGMTIWEVANGRGLKIPHLCHKPAPGYRPDGNCRACMVEIEGERVLAARHWRFYAVALVTIVALVGIARGGIARPSSVAALAVAFVIAFRAVLAARFRNGWEPLEGWTWVVGIAAATLCCALSFEALARL